MRIAFLALVTAVHASVGDRSPAYQSCVSDCLAIPCSLPLSLRLTNWNCLDDCRYHCQQNLTDLIEAGQQLEGLSPHRVVQFHGKWPFTRFAGIQEPLSVIFSLLNLYGHIQGRKMLRRSLPRNIPTALSSLYNLLPFAGINLWVWSSIFHTRDTPITEKLDYFSAAISIMLNLYIAIIRLSNLYHPTTPQKALRNLLATIALSVLAAHIFYLSFWTFDYGYNMLFNVTLGILHNLLWLSWTLYHFFSSSRPPHLYAPAAVLCTLSACTALELLDFPPWGRLLDAHALWHAATIPIVPAWYWCLVQDAKWLAGEQDEGTLTGRSRGKGKLG